MCFISQTHSPRFESLPEHILEEIVLSGVNATSYGPPTSLASLLRVCKRISSVLARENNPVLYARIFRSRFDTAAPYRRFGQFTLGPSQRADECIRRFKCMQRLRSNTYTESDEDNALLRQDLWTAYLMFLENDGKNMAQLIDYGNINILASNFVRMSGRLHKGVSEAAGWTVDNEINALVLWVFWFTDDERVQKETPADRENILDALSSIFLGSFKYPSTYAPLTTFQIPPSIVPPIHESRTTFLLPTSPTYLPSIVEDYFGQRLVLSRPLMTAPALLSCLVRLGGCNKPPNASTCRDQSSMTARAQSIKQGWSGASTEKYDRLGMRSLNWSQDSSFRHEHDWQRLLCCYNPWTTKRVSTEAFSPGQFKGTWEGRWLTVPSDFFHNVVNTAREGRHIDHPLNYLVIQQPMEFCVREYYQTDPKGCMGFEDMSTDGIGNGVLNGWRPSGIEIAEAEGKLDIFNPETRDHHVYGAHVPIQEFLDEHMARSDINAPFQNGVWDIVLTAKSHDDYAQVWGHDRYFGRVRAWDGLVLLVRERRHGVGRWIFHGYIYNGQNLVGRWRETGTPVTSQGLEGVWGMVKSSRFW